MITLIVVGYAFISQQANLASEWQVFLPLYAVSVLFIADVRRRCGCSGG